VGLSEVGGSTGSSSWIATHLPRVLGWGAGILMGALFMVGGFPLAPADVPWVLQWLRYISPFAFAYDSFVASQLAAGAAGQGFAQVNPSLNMLLLLLLACLLLLASIFVCASDYFTSVAGPRAIEAVLATLSSGVQVCKECMGRGWSVSRESPDEKVRAGEVDATNGSNGYGYSANASQYSRSGYQSAAPGEWEDEKPRGRGRGGGDGGGGNQPPITSYV